jgi:mRNA-degrading endonuclease RelE of RelBE toxin-antitoxin system
MNSEKPKNTVITSKNFRNEAKILSKKYKTLKTELVSLETELLRTPKAGQSMGNGLYKIRLASKSKGKGKRGGFRVITYLIEHDTVKDVFEINLITIYDKSDVANVLKDDIIKALKDILG